MNCVHAKKLVAEKVAGMFLYWQAALLQLCFVAAASVANFSLSVTQVVSLLQIYFNTCTQKDHIASDVIRSLFRELQKSNSAGA